MRAVFPGSSSRAWTGVLSIVTRVSERRSSRFAMSDNLAGGRDRACVDGQKRKKDVILKLEESAVRHVAWWEHAAVVAWPGIAAVFWRSSARW